MTKERLDTLQEIVLDHSDRIVGCAQIQRPDERENYVGFGDVIQVEEDAVALVEDPLRTGRTDFHIVKVPRELAVTNPWLRKLLV